MEKERKKKKEYEDREMMKQILDCSRFLMLKMNGHETRASLLFAAIRESSHDFETLQFSFPSSSSRSSCSPLTCQTCVAVIPIVNELQLP